MRKTPPIKIIVHYPQTQQGKQELAQRLADVHADAVVSAINKLDCPPDVKIGTTNFCKKISRIRFPMVLNHPETLYGDYPIICVNLLRGVE